MILEYDGYECLLAPTGQEGIALGRARDPRPRVSRHQDAGHGRARGAAADQRRRRNPADRDHLGSWDRQHGGRGDQAGGVRFPGKTAGQRARERHDSERPRPAPPARREPIVEASRGRSPRDGRGEPGAPAGHRTPLAGRGPPTRRCSCWVRAGVGKGIGRARDPQEQSSGARAVRPGQLRRDSGGLDRIGAVRSREGVVHGCHRTADREVRAGRPGGPSFSTRSET